MNKLSKILISIIVILVIALGFSTFSYFRMLGIAKNNLDSHIEHMKLRNQLYLQNEVNSENK